MSDKKLDSFKIGETQRPTVASPKKALKPDLAVDSQRHSLGFMRIEKILEENDSAAVGDSLNKLLQSLEEFEAKATAQKDKAAAKRAVIAVERTVDLLDYLFQTKASMQSTK